MSGVARGPAPARRRRARPGPAAGAAAAATALLALLAAAPAASGQRAGGLPPDTASVPGENSPRVDSLTTRVSSQLRCPVCRSQSVLESSSDLAERMQAVIRDRLARGESPAEVRAYFVDKYGEWILLRPRAEGINLLVYVLPALALVGGGWAVARRLRAWSTDGAAATAGGGEESAARAGSDAPGEDAADESGSGGARPATSELDLPEEDRKWLERELRER